MNKERKYFLLSLSAADMNIVEQRAIEFKTTKTGIIRSLIREEAISNKLKMFQENMNFTHEMLFQTSKIGNNINQIARKIHTLNTQEDIKTNKLLKKFIKEAKHIKEIFKAVKLLSQENINIANSYKRK